MHVMDDQGVLFEQKVLYDWTSPFCKVCNVVGHNCDIKKKVQGKTQQAKPQVARKWVPKNVKQKANGNQGGKGA